jgi:hypothetical protein
MVHSTADELYRFEFEFYCKEPYDLKLDPFDTPFTQQFGSVASSRTEYDTSASFLEAMDIDRRLYIYDHIKLGAYQYQSLALDPWSCMYYVVDVYPTEDRPALEEQLQHVKKIPVSLNRAFYLVRILTALQDIRTFFTLRAFAFARSASMLAYALTTGGASSELPR